MMSAIGDIRLDVWFYGPDEESKLADDGPIFVDGRVRWVVGARYAVWKYRWNGKKWRRFRRVTGPMRWGDAVSRMAQMESDGGERL